MLCMWGLKTTKLNNAAKNSSIFVSYRKEKYLNKKKLHDVAKKYGKIRKIKIKQKGIDLKESMQ